jgi:23S rRNA (guanosine2251-2'-O)-methyltransferase
MRRWPPPGLDQLEGRNVVYEALLRERRRVVRIHLDARARELERVQEILDLAVRRAVPVDRVPRESLDQLSETGVHNGIMAWAEPLPEWSTHALLDELLGQGKAPFFVLIDEVQYEHNLGAVLRTALGAGAHAVVVPVKRGKGLSPVVQRVAMGAAEVVPLIREGLSSSLATLRRAGVPVVGADMGGAPCWEVPMAGPLALVLGGEDKGLSHTLRERCNHIATVPTQGGLQSLNVSVTAAILMYEKLRQDAAPMDAPAGQAHRRS